MNTHLLAVGVMCSLLTACSPRYNPANTPFAIYHPIAEDNVRKLEKGMTTPGETVKLFGEPTKKNISDRGERYVYGYLGDTLSVTFDSSHTVSSFLYRPAIFEPVEGNTDHQNKKINTARLKKIQIYNTTRFDLERWFRKANKKERNNDRFRYTFIRRNGTLVVYTLANYEERVLSYTFTPAE
ncbi:hypothetical protein [Agriterribacter sp.]|uniref:hypothetical protein n=1 Tax=Agriterribacter sp. TaxID=2821509 RepID=UPI002C0B2B38|nr:hypothetical protein [Agriterribacter sp.]HRP58436.1 hypothetical protein [Agriterribacter sp.]